MSTSTVKVSAGVRDLWLVLIVVPLASLALLMGWLSPVVIGGVSASAKLDPSHFEIQGYPLLHPQPAVRNLFDYAAQPDDPASHAEPQRTMFDLFVLEGIMQRADTVMAFIKINGERRVMKKGDEVIKGVRIKEMDSHSVLMLDSVSGASHRYYLENH